MRAPSLATAVLAIVAAALAAAPARAQNCGAQAGGALCPNGLCCSRFGFCGTTPENCGDGCQSQCGGGGPGPVCGSQAGGATCPNCLCYSRFGFCGSTPEHCGDGCQSQCNGCVPSPGPGPAPGPTPPGDEGVASILPRDLFERLLLHRNDYACPARWFYTYDAFLAAAAAFPVFADVAGNNTETRKREVAAFLGQTSHETTGGWDTAPDGPYSWGYCFKVEQQEPKPVYCEPSPEWPCAPGKRYYGRGPIQLSYNYNYGPAGQAPVVGMDLLNNPDLVAFKTALWFWMTPRDNKPSSQAVITGQ